MLLEGGGDVVRSGGERLCGCELLEATTAIDVEGKAPVRVLVWIGHGRRVGHPTRRRAGHVSVREVRRRGCSR